MNFTKLTCVLSLLAVSAPAFAQQPQPLTYVALFRVEPGNTAAFLAVAKEYTPTMDKLFADGVITAYGVDVDYLHRPNVSNVAFWYTTNNYANLSKAESEVMAFQAKSPETVKKTAALTDLSKHQDLIMKSLESNHAGAGSCGKTPVSLFNLDLVKPGKMQSYLGAFRSTQKPILDQLVKDGVVCSYSLDVEDFHSMTPGSTWGIVTIPDLAAMDKLDAAFEAAEAKLAAGDRAARQLQRVDQVDLSKHEDSISTSVIYKSK